MKEGWEYKKLGDVCEILNGFAFKSSKYVPEGIRVIRITNVQKGRVEDNDPKFYPLSSKNEIERYLLKEGDLLVSLTGNVGRVGRLPRNLLPAALNQRVACLRLKGNIVDKQYLYHFLNSDYFENICTKNSSGVAQLNLSTVWLSNFKVFIPSLSEQQRIVDYLDSAFAKIDAMKANAEKSLNEAKALFQASLKEMFEPKEGWEEKKIGDICEIIRGKRFVRTDIVDDGVPCIHYGDIYTHYGLSVTKTRGCLKPELAKKMRFAEKNDVVVVQAGENNWDIGVGVAYFGDEPAAVHDACFILKHKQNPMYISYYLRSYNYHWYLVDFVHEGKICSFLKPALQNAPIPLPPLSEQQRIVATLDSLKSKVDCLQANFEKISQECDALKQAILSQVFE